MTMANRDLQELPKFSDKWSYMYFEKGHIEQYARSVAFCYLEKRVPVPIETLASLLLGPGTTITHEAIKTIIESRCTVLWVGEQGVKCYAAAQAATYSARNLLQQVSCFENESERMRIVRKMYAMRFYEIVPNDITLDQLRGKEGARVRKAYKEAAEKYGIKWQGRNYDQTNWKSSDPVNRALSAANSCLYGICLAAIISIGCSPGIGFVHTGKQLSFVYDIADLYKTELTVPIAFLAASSGEKKTDSLARPLIRDEFRKRRFLKTIIPDILRLLYGDSISREDDNLPEGSDVAINY